MGARLLTVRIVSTIVILFASFIMGWYVFSRLEQLYRPVKYKVEEEVNNPRLNVTILNSLSENFEKRQIYSKTTIPQVEIPEKDPFNE